MSSLSGTSRWRFKTTHGTNHGIYLFIIVSVVNCSLVYGQDASGFGMLAGDHRVSVQEEPLNNIQFQQTVIPLTDLNFDTLVNGSADWMINLHSPWCPACQEMSPVWERLVPKAREKGYLVGKVNVQDEKVLLHRFQITKLPTVVYVSREERAVYEYRGAFTVNSMHQFASRSWRKEAPDLTGCASPVSFCGRCIGSFVTWPKKVKHGFLTTRKDFKYGDVTLIGLILGGPVLIGLCGICLLDAYVSKRSVHRHNE
jgi:thiol-disulfide isomerase/thioredoxin